MGNIILRSTKGFGLFDEKMVDAFGETAVELEPWSQNDKEDASKINANYIKSSYGEDFFDDNYAALEICEPFGHMIAAHEPDEDAIDQFWKMCIQQDVGKLITIGESGDSIAFPTGESGLFIKNKGKNFEIELRCDPSKT